MRSRPVPAKIAATSPPFWLIEISCQFS